MKPIKFKDVNIVYGANQPEYKPLPAQRVGKEQTGQINTCWKLTKEEIKLLKKARTLALKRLGKVKGVRVLDGEP